MPRLILQFDDRVLKQWVIGPTMTIGRLPDNIMVIDNAAVSGHHARVFREGDDFVLEDLGSTNGTYVNQKHVIRHTLENGDVVLVGKHKLVFDRTTDAAPIVAEPVVSNMGDTVYLDTKKHRALLATLREARSEATRGAAPANTHVVAEPAAPTHRGVLRVLAGHAAQSEYKLEAHTSLIGASNAALIRLHGWFKPQVALAIARSGEGYVATPLDGKTLINNQPLRGRHELRHHDIIEVCGLVLGFRLKAPVLRCKTSD